MKRTILLATALAAVLALPAMAEDANSKVAPGNDPTSTTTNQVSPNDKVATLSLTDQEGKAWLDKPIYTSDGLNIGEVVDFQRDAANNVIGMRADIGGVLGFGQTRVNVTTLQFTLSGDRVLLDMTAEQAKSLPKATI